jgi:hypothetical protein
MSQADRLQTTPASIHDAIETQIPYQYRAEVNHLFWQLKQDAPIHLDTAIPRAHAIASQLAAIVQSQPTPGLHTDAEPAACVRVAAYLNAAVDEARRRVPSPYRGSTTDAASLSARDAAYQAMVDYNSNAWRTAGAQPSTHQADSSQPAVFGDIESAWKAMVEHDQNAHKTVTVNKGGR